MHRFTVLYIDDHDSNLYTMQALLSDLSHLHVVLANSGAKGLEILLSQEIDLILLDVQMPDMDGFAVAEFVKKNKKTLHIPIVFVSAVFTSNEFIKRGYRSGAIDYLAKPIDDDQLLNKLSFYFRLFEQQKALTYEKTRLQNILDSQDNLILVVDRNSIFQANRSFLDFTGFSSLRAFTKKHFCISDLFIEGEGYLQGDPEKSWLDTVMGEVNKNHIAIMSYRGQNHYFAVSVNILDRKREQFVITFTDVTHIQEGSIKFKHEAARDPLTKIYNRRMFDRESEKLLYLAQKYRLELSVLLIDIDHFKLVNDTHGHQKGDAVLIEVVKRIASKLRKGDLFARYGGEEFVIVLLKSSISEATHKAHKINVCIAENSFEHIGKLTISIGVAAWNEDESFSAILQRADKALYSAKANGRNRVEVME